MIPGPEPSMRHSLAPIRGRQGDEWLMGRARRRHVMEDSVAVGMRSHNGRVRAIAFSWRAENGTVNGV